MDNQKDLIQDFSADLIDKLNTDVLDLNDIKTEFEIQLQNLNTKLKSVADQFDNIEYFPIK